MTNANDKTVVETMLQFLEVEKNWLIKMKKMRKINQRKLQTFSIKTDIQLNRDLLVKTDELFPDDN